MQTNSCIFLNGPSSAGKTSIAHAFLMIAGPHYKHFSMDDFLSFYSTMRQSNMGESESPERAVQVMAGFAKNMMQMGDRLIIDAVAMPDAMAIWRERLKPMRPYLVYVDAPLDVLNSRERARGDRAKGLAREQVIATRQAANYHSYIDTSRLTPQEAAGRILNQFDDWIRHSFAPANATGPHVPS